MRDEPYTDGKQQKIKQKGNTERMQSIWCPYFHQSRNEKENNSGGFLFPPIHREDSHTATSRTTCVVKLKQATAVLLFSSVWESFRYVLHALLFVPFDVSSDVTG